MSAKASRLAATTVALVGLLVQSCSADHPGVSSDGRPDASLCADPLAVPVESRAAVARIDELRMQFQIAEHPERLGPGLARGALPLPTHRAALGPAIATRLEAVGGRDSGTHVRVVVPNEALRGVMRPALVALPLRADGEVALEDEVSHLSVRFALEHAQAAHLEVAGGMALYRGALDGADVVHRVHAEGTEDFVFFQQRPAREELSYGVDVSRVQGLRLVSNTLEFLDETGTPLLRVAPPYVVDRGGEYHEAKLEVNGCAYDTNPAGPWERSVTPAGATRCTVLVRWGGGIAYPAMVDPVWGATGSMATSRSRHTASVLASGRVLVAGGGTASAELYDPGGNSGAGTFAATGAMGTARGGHVASVLPSGKVLVAGGDGSGFLASAELFDPGGNAGAGVFKPTGSMGFARSGHTASVLSSGKVLVVGGCNSVACFASAELFDPAGNSGAGAFSATGSMATAREYHVASVLSSGKVLVAGGCAEPCSSAAFSTAEVFDPAANAGIGAFVGAGPMATGRRHATANLLPSGKVLIGGGCGGGCGSAYSSAELFDPAGNAGAGTFSATGSMADARRSHTAITFPSGKVLVVGGYGTVTLSSAELFDPAGNAGAGTFTSTAFMANARAQHTASLLPSGRALVAGGATTSAEIFGGALGDACQAGGACLSGFCADGFCCNVLCSGGGCDRCDLAGKEGTCTVAPVGNSGANPSCAPYACDGASAACPTSCISDATCADADYCAPTGTCQPRKPIGTACNTQTECKEPGCRECASGSCADGVCCDKPCAGQCEACDSVPGTCSSVIGAPHGGRPACPSGKACGASTNACEVGAATCDGNHTTTAGDGTKRDCAPYKCDSNGDCRLACTSVNDCVAPTICDTNGKCTAPGAGGDGGCTISAVGLGASDESSQLAWIAAVAGLTIARLRRRSGVTPSGRSQPLRWRRLGLRAERACCSEPHP